MAVFRLLAVGAFRHSHDFHELFLVTKGTGRHELFSPTGSLHEVSALAPGELISIPLGWSHSYRQSESLEIFNVLFATQLLDKWPHVLEQFSIFDLSSQVPTRWSLQRGEYEHLEIQLQIIARELLGQKPGYDVAAQAKLLDVLVWIERLRSQSSERRPPESDGAALRATAFMEQRFAQPITIDDIARTAHLSANYFSEVFKEATGLSPGRYLMRLRLEHAHYLLLSTSLSVTHIARESGFADPSHFARAFKAAYGTAPSRLRKTGELS